MRIAKLVIGILCIVLSLFIVFQSCAAGVYNTLSESGELSGSAGLLVAIMFLVGGIVMIATRSSQKAGGDIAVIILFAIGALLGFSFSGSYEDLIVWAACCLLLIVFSIISIFLKIRESGKKI